MKFIQGQDRTRINLFPVSLDQSIDPENEVRIIDLFVDSAYNYENFRYDNQTDTYTCPQGEVMRTNGSWYTTHGRRNILISFKQYKTSACKSCQAMMKCTRSKTGRLIERSIYADNYERNRLNTKEKEQLYKRRQTIVEHPFGTIKRQWGFSYILTKRGMKRASADVELMFIACNLRRIVNILTRDQLKRYLRIFLSLYLTISDLIPDKFRQFKRLPYLEWSKVNKNQALLNPV